MISRVAEKKELKRLLDSQKSELLAITGRRRVGKTYLVKEYFADNLVFEFTGTQYAERDNQLNKFSIKLSEFTKLSLKIPNNWAEAFSQLRAYLEERRKTKKRWLFFSMKFLGLILIALVF